ncbi:MAG: hypothetical protein HY717_02380 [Planctomycetes bacterium]|nr:hypothetical protein [Planctomycetota bacterium]
MIPPGELPGQQPSERKPDESALDQFLKEKGIQPAPQPSPSGAESKPAAPSSADLWSRPAGGANLRLIDISLDGLFAAGASTERNSSIENLEGGGHDPHKRGFTIQNVEFSLVGAVDPYVSGEAHLVYFIDAGGESQVELEEAFLTTQSLPFGLQIEAGQSFAEFGRINPIHPHAWHWIDQPIINSRLFGEDGLRGPGFRIGLLTPLPWFSELHFGMLNASGETAASFFSSAGAFDERPIGGRPFVDQEVRSLNDLLYLARWDHGFDVTETVSAKTGASGLYGPNATGLDGYTFIYGADAVVKWRPVNNRRGWPFVILESEIMGRYYKADSFFSDSGTPGNPADDISLDGAVLQDWGFYAQVLYGFMERWAAGFRYEYAAGSGRDVQVDLAASTFATGIDRNTDPLRDDRHRFSPLLTCFLTEFTRFRLQYNLDHAEHLDPGKYAHSVWLGAEIIYGKHPAHSF